MGSTEPEKVLGVSTDVIRRLFVLAEHFSSESQPAFYLIGKPEDVPADLRESAMDLVNSVPQSYAERARRHFWGRDLTEEHFRWLTLAYLIEDAKALRFRRILQGLEPNPLEPAFVSAGLAPDAEGLIQTALLGDFREGPTLGKFDVEISRSLPRASNSTYWLGPMITSNSSCRVRLDPLRFAPLGELSRVFYAMQIYGPPFDWDRVLNLRANEAVKWMADDGSKANPELITELVWKPRGSEIILEIEELPTNSDVGITGSRYLHGVVNRKERCFTHLDGAIRWFDEVELSNRSDTRLDRSGAVGQRTKVFRLDEAIAHEHALDIISAFFVWNYDIDAYFDPTSPKARMSVRKPEHFTFSD